MAFMNRKPREIGRLRTEYSPPPEAEAAIKMTELLKNAQHMTAFNGHEIPDDPEPMRQLDIMEELKLNCRRLTWAQMMEFCTATGADPTKVHEWSSKHD